VAGIDSDRLGVVWFDAHADFDTPDDNVSGFFDVMGLGILTGGGWPALRQTIPGLGTVPERHVLLAAVRDLEPYQRARLEASEVRVLPGRFDPADLRARLDDLRRDVDRVYLHVDLDALDRSVGRANEYAAAGGPSLEEMLGAVDDVYARFAVEAAAITSYDPSLDTGGAIAAAARRIGGAIARGAHASLEART
jgi:arginase